MWKRICSFLALLAFSPLAMLGPAYGSVGYFYNGLWWPMEGIGNASQVISQNGVTVVNPGAPAWTSTATSVEARVVTVNPGAAVWDAGSTGTEPVLEMTATSASETAVEAAAVSMDIPVQLEVGLATQAAAATEVGQWGLSAVTVASGLAGLLAVGIVGAGIYYNLNSNACNAWVQKQLGWGVNPNTNQISLVSQGSVNGHLTSSSPSPGSYSFSYGTNQYTVVGIFDNSTDASAAVAGCGTVSYSGGAPSLQASYGWSGWGLVEATGQTVNGYTQKYDAYYCASTSYYNGTNGTTYGNPVTESQLQSALQSGLSSHDHATENMAVDAVNQLMPMWNAAAGGNFNQMPQSSWQSASQTLANNVPSNYYTNIVNNNSGSSYVTNQNSNSSNSNSAGQSANNPLYVDTVNGSGSTVSDSSIQNDIQSALNSEVSTPPSPAGLSGPTVPDKLSLTSVLQTFVASFQSLPIVSALTGYTIGVSNACSYFTYSFPGIAGYGASTITFDFGPYQSQVQALGNAAYFFCCLFWTIWLFRKD